MATIKDMLTTKRLLFLIILFGFLFRIFGIDWDQGFHLHPDERAIVLAVVKLIYPTTFAAFFSPDSAWNTKFFAYGSFPMYLLYFAGQKMSIFNPQFASYDGINIVGRFISALMDTGTILVLFFMGKKLSSDKAGLITAFFYAISVLPIQLSHFYAVDTMLTFFITLCLFLFLRLYEKIDTKKCIIAGVCFGLALATKISAIVLVVPLFAVFWIHFALVGSKNKQTRKHAFFLSLQNMSLYGLLIALVTLLTFLFFEPYALIDHQTFWDQTVYQSMMTKDAFVFPYTLQYVGKIDYIYELKNIFLFGLGPLLGILCFLGTGFMLFKVFDERKHTEMLSILFSFFIIYFYIVGGFAIGFMRYMLPLYPLFCLFGALFCARLLIYHKRHHYRFFGLLIVAILLLLIWPLSFSSIYTHPNTRVQATAWIRHYIPPGKTLAIEHWDDGLPLGGQEQYTIETLALYDPDTPEKWATIENQLKASDYIIIASNRLYVPLQKLTDCTKLPRERCYPKTAAYYHQLFSGQLGFTKVAAFTDNPTIPLLHIPLNDQSADESFTVYDHPKVLIYKKE